jgi:hypothetical protein
LWLLISLLTMRSDRYANNGMYILNILFNRI